MTVDMFEHRFRQELNRLEPFHPNDTRDPRVWPRRGSHEGEFPAWRALFTALCLHRHSTGYRLPSYEEFFNFCRSAYTKHHPRPDRFVPYFQGELLAGMRQRVGVWYESGIAETYLYACLAEAIEDRAKVGVVLYDPRADWKLKADIVVILNGQAMRVSAYVGHGEDRPDLESERDVIEHERKRNTPESAHWGNSALRTMPPFGVIVKSCGLGVVRRPRTLGCRAKVPG
ncbi:hypothetical protein IU469_32685 [Nocardia puris]|uniref:hypothetical protein n=1 Tax=Nocardia puris TaxID=208602 RepID=UPI001895F094|nr:hypothetical protein [Nocardia puris]MBF6370419.1 hypothetical protein [Nocardia puris]